MKNTIPDRADDEIATRIAQNALSSRGADYSAEVRRLLDAGRAVMRRCGTDTRPRVIDIVAEAGLSNDAFYRHFKTKDALVVAILEDGTMVLRSYLAHRVATATTPEAQVRAWVDGILAQAGDEETAAITTAVMWNAGGMARQVVPLDPAELLAPLVVPALAELGSPDPEGDAMLAAHAVLGALSDHLRTGRRPSRRFVEGVVDFHLAAVAR